MTNTRLIVTKNEFRRIGAELLPKVTEVITATALAVEAEAKELAPVKTGNLRRSITYQPIDATHAEVGTDVEYAPYQEFGTSTVPAHPYLTPAVEHKRAPFMAALKRLFS